jgi:branched-chain amino acid transport system ATP-binding protein
MSMLAIERVRKSYGGAAVVDDASLAVPEGGLVGLIGPNGAGKSTLFAVVSGFQAADRGRVVLRGRAIDGLAPHARVRLGLGRTFQVPREFRHLTVRENLMAAAPAQAGEGLATLFLAPGRIAREEAALRRKADALLEFLNLAAVAGQPAFALSGGQKKLLELGRALMVEPRCLLLDEPFAGVNPVLIGEIVARIRELNRRGIAFLIVEHNLHALSGLVGEMHAMDRGRIIASGAPRAVLADPAVLSAYLGGEASRIEP